MLAALVLMGTACGAETSGGGGGASAPANFPQDDLTIIAAGSAGGGLDTAGRMLQKGLRDAGVDVSVNVEDNGGGGGNPARAEVLKRPNDGRTVVAESNRVFLNPLLGTTDMTLDDFQPIAAMTSDYEVWAVKADSKYKTAKQVLQAVKADPHSVSFGVGTIPSDDQFNILLAAKHFGVSDLKAVNIVAFRSGGDLNTELLGGHVEVVSTGLSEAGELAKAGKIRLLSVSSPKPLGGDAKDVPTWNQLGLDFSLPHWRGVFGPAGMPKTALDWWVKEIRKATQTQAWKDQTEKLGLQTMFQGPEEFLDKTIEPQRKEFTALAKEVGLAGQGGG